MNPRHYAHLRDTGDGKLPPRYDRAVAFVLGLPLVETDDPCLWIPVKCLYTAYLCAVDDPLSPAQFARSLHLAYPLAEPTRRNEGGRVVRGWGYLTVRDDAAPEYRAWVRRTPDKPGPKGVR